jgi:hypothetical protein
MPSSQLKFIKLDKILKIKKGILREKYTRRNSSADRT